MLSPTHNLKTLTHGAIPGICFPTHTYLVNPRQHSWHTSKEASRESLQRGRKQCKGTFCCLSVVELQRAREEGMVTMAHSASQLSQRISHLCTAEVTHLILAFDGNVCTEQLQDYHILPTRHPPVPYDTETYVSWQLINHTRHSYVCCEAQQKGHCYPNPIIVPCKLLVTPTSCGWPHANAQ